MGYVGGQEEENKKEGNKSSATKTRGKKRVKKEGGRE